MDYVKLENAYWTLEMHSYMETWFLVILVLVRQDSSEVAVGEDASFLVRWLLSLLGRLRCLIF
jgi:hypothetical protein